MTQEEIKKLLDGRKVVDAYLSVKMDRSDPNWKHPSVPDLIKSLQNLGFDSIDDFFLYDAKSSYQELADCIEVISTKNSLEKNPMCDNCAGREPAGCKEVLRLISGSPSTCKDSRDAISIESAKSFVPTAVMATDPILEAYRTKAASLDIDSKILVTLTDVLWAWNYPGHFFPKCLATIKQTRDFAFDPFWRLGEFCYPVVNIDT